MALGTGTNILIWCWNISNSIINSQNCLIVILPPLILVKVLLSICHMNALFTFLRYKRNHESKATCTNDSGPFIATVQLYKVKHSDSVFLWNVTINRKVFGLLQKSVLNEWQPRMHEAIFISNINHAQLHFFNLYIKLPIYLNLMFWFPCACMKLYIIKSPTKFHCQWIPNIFTTNP